MITAGEPEVDSSPAEAGCDVACGVRSMLQACRTAAIAALFMLSAGSAAQAICPAPETVIATCQIEGQEKQLSICLSGSAALYRFGPLDGSAELTLQSPLMNLGFITANGAGGTIDEIVTFRNKDYAYQIVFGFRDGQKPDVSELHKFGKVSVTQNDKTITELSCVPQTINRVHDRLLQAMRDIGRERNSDGLTFSNYPIQYPSPAAESPPCAQQFNVDTCWSFGVAAARGGDVALALGHYDKSCAANLGTQGCYEAGKIYLQNKKLRDYVRAYDRFTRVCDSEDVGQGPFACKYLGWMHLTGIGATADTDKAWQFLSKACFFHNDALIVDAEGCHFFAETVQKVSQTKGTPQRGGYLAYLALAMGCADHSEGLCAEARSHLATAASAPWVARCDQELTRDGPAQTCADLITLQQDYDANELLRRQIFMQILPALEMED